MEPSASSPSNIFSGPEPSRYLALISFAILYYDYLLTLSMEVDYFWKQQRWFSWTSLLFILNRYMAVFGVIPIAMEFFADLSSDQCHLQTVHQAISAATQAVVSALLVIRTYALYNRSKRMLAVLLVVYAIGAVAGIWSVTASNTSATSVSDVSTTSCNNLLTALQSDYLVAPWGAMLLFDTTIFVLTLYKSVGLLRLAPRSVPILQVMLRDGTIYFAVLMVVNIVNILTFLLGNAYTRGMGTSLINALSSDLVSRLMLNLRDPKLMRLPQHTQPQPASGTMRSRWNKPQDVELSVVEISSHATSSGFDELSTDILPPTDTTMLP